MSVIFWPDAARLTLVANVTGPRRSHQFRLTLDTGADRTVVPALLPVRLGPRDAGTHAGGGRGLRPDGCDHCNSCYSPVLAGGRVKGEGCYVHGASDRIGAKPSRNPVTPADVVATVYECLGVPHDLELQDRLARPYVLCPWGKPIRGVLAGPLDARNSA